METLNGVSIVECWVWKVCLRLILIRETKKNIVRWVLSVGASRKVTHLTLSVWRFWISIRVWTRNWLSDIYSKGGWHRCVCVCVSYPHLLPLKMNLCRVGTLLLYPIIGWRYDTNIWLQRSMLGAKMESSWNRYIISRCNCLFFDTNDLIQATICRPQEHRKTQAPSPQNSSLAQTGHQPPQCSPPYHAPTHATLQDLHAPIHLSFQWSTATTYAYHFKVKGPAREVCLDAGEVNETHEDFNDENTAGRTSVAFMSTKYSERPHQRRREYKGEVRPSEHVAERSV